MESRRSTLIEGLFRYNWSKIKQIRLAPPARCTFCAAATAGGPVCPPCLGDLPWRTHTLLRQRAVHASFRYAFPVVQCIGRAKLGGDCGLARQLGRWMASRPAVEAAEVDLVCAVPLAWGRAVGRGYNQALEIAKPIAAMLQCPLSTNVLRRSSGVPQRSLGRRARQGNVLGRFTAAGRVAGLRVLVIDDVTTTGATFREAERALRAAGAASVIAWAAAAVD